MTNNGLSAFDCSRAGCYAAFRITGRRPLGVVSPAKPPTSGGLLDVATGAARLGPLEVTPQCSNRRFHLLGTTSNGLPDLATHYQWAPRYGHKQVAA